MLLLRDFILVLVPAVIVMVMVYLMLRYFLKENARQFEFLKNEQELQRLKMAIEKKMVSDKAVITHKLQAYERMTLFLERINPPNLITRNITPGQKSGELQKRLLHSIREEYEHNMSQQIYLQPATWELIKKAKEEVTALINSAMTADMVDKDAGIYAQEILTKGFEKKNDPVEKALQSIKNELADL